VPVAMYKKSRRVGSAEEIVVTIQALSPYRQARSAPART
jgi:hypothetical protein